MTASGGSAAAHDATVDGTADPGVSRPDPVADAEANVAAAKTKVKKQQEHLAGAKQAVTEAEAALAAAKKG